MKIVHIIDKENFYVEDMIIEENQTLDCNYVEIRPPSFYRAKWIPEEQKWIEGVDQNYLDEKTILQSLQPNHNEIENAEFELKVLNLLIEMRVI